MILGSVAAPMFAFLTGASFALWWRKQQATKQRESRTTRIAVRRGVFLFFLGILFNAAIWLPEETFNWDILTLLGTALILLALVRWLPRPVLLLGCVLLLLLSPPLRVISDFPAYWEDESFTYDFTPRDLVFGYLANGYFPLFPWLVFPLVGFVSAEWLFTPHKHQRRTQGRVALVALAMLALVALLQFVHSPDPSLLARYYADGLTEFPASTEYVVGMLGFVLLLVVLAQAWQHSATSTASRWWNRMLRRFSNSSLTLYVVHHMAILWPLWLYGAFRSDDDTTYYWRNAMPTLPALALSLLLIGACYALCGWLARHPRYSLETIMRHWCDGQPRLP
jgi:uncharacterized membrane protein